MTPTQRRPTPKPAAPRKRSGERVEPGEVTLRKGRGAKGTGGDSGGYYWHIDLRGQRVGRVFINRIDEAPFGLHASIQIYINRSMQSRGIGSIAYRLACEASEYDAVYAHMRKSNVASRKAAESASFRVVAHPDVRQLAMVWQRR